MQDLEVSVLTNEYLAEPVAAADPAVDVTQLAVWMAVLPEGHNPAAGDWVQANWHHDDITDEDIARSLLGSDLPLQRGVLTAWIRLDTGAELLVRAFARLLVS